jgi:1-aminocyclopropane-1-carboxylate deaminase
VRSYSNRKTATLKRADFLGMQLKFIPPSSFEAEKKVYLNGLARRYHFIEMGGANQLGVLGCAEILNGSTVEYDYIAVACGTGSTLSGIMNSAERHQNILGFPAYKSDERLHNDISKFLVSKSSKSKLEIMAGYDFGGFGKMDENLIRFIKTFYDSTKIPLDGIYTGKMMFGLFEMLHHGYFPTGSKILAIHTGGLQGNIGLNKKYKAELPVPSF